MGSVDSIDCQEGSRKIPICQVGRDEQMRLSEGLINSEVSLNQPEELTEEENLRDLLMIGGIQVFLPFAQEEAEICVVDVEAATTEEGQPAETVKEELKQTLGAAQEEKENEHSEEWLNAFSQEAEEAAALKLAAEEAEEQADKLITPWEMELQMLEDWLNNPEPAGELAEVELSEKMTEQQVSQEETAELKSAAEWTLSATEEDEEDGMGDHSDLPNCRKNLQPRRLHEQGQPLE
jgi:hypothetical protein